MVALYHLRKVLIKQAFSKKIQRHIYFMSNTESRTGTLSHITQCNSSIGKCLSCDLLYDRMYEIETFEYAHAHAVD